MTLHMQLSTMIAMGLGGCFIGFSFDTYRRLTTLLRQRAFGHYVLENIFWLLQTALMYYVLFQVNEGELRFYVFLACLLGYSMYVVIFRHWYKKILEACIQVVKTVFGWLVHTILTLFVRPLQWVVTVIYKLLKAIIIFTFRPLLRLLYGLCRWLVGFIPAPILKKGSQIYAICSTIVNTLKNKVARWLRKWR